MEWTRRIAPLLLRQSNPSVFGSFDLYLSSLFFFFPIFVNVEVSVWKDSGTVPDRLIDLSLLLQFTEVYYDGGCLTWIVNRRETE